MRQMRYLQNIILMTYLCSTSAQADGGVMLTTTLRLVCVLAASVTEVSACRNRMTPSMASRILVVREVEMDPTCSCTPTHPNADQMIDWTNA
jgi:hypothetical protein